MNGYSAGGHLAALSVMNPKYGLDQSNISGIILNDAAGLDMYWQSTWINDPVTQKDASPIYFIAKESPKFLILNGTKSLAIVVKTNNDFITKLKEVQP